MGCGANGASPVGPPGVGADAVSRGGVGLVAGNPVKIEARIQAKQKTKSVGGVLVGSGAEQSCRSGAGGKGGRGKCPSEDRRTATVLRAPSRNAHASDSDAHHSEGSYWCDPTQWDRKIRQAYPSHHIIRPVAPVGASVGPVPPVCHPTHDDAPHKRSHLAYSVLLEIAQDIE